LEDCSVRAAVVLVGELHEGVAGRLAAYRASSLVPARLRLRSQPPASLLLAGSP